MRKILKAWLTHLLPLSAIILVWLPTSTMAAQEEIIVTLRSTVTGNQEQPKVLYIVPWQQPGGPENLYEPMRRANDVFNPIDREEFVRELRYRQMIDRAQSTTP